MLFESNEMIPYLIDDFQRVSSYLTIVQYFKVITELPDTSFPRMRTLLFHVSDNISSKFFKCELFYMQNLIDFTVWEKSQWQVEKIVIYGVSGSRMNLGVFDQLRYVTISSYFKSCLFSDTIRNGIKSFQYMASFERNSKNIGPLKPVYRDLAKLKRLFPSLIDFVGKFNFLFIDDPVRYLVNFLNYIELESPFGFLLTRIKAAHTIFSHKNRRGKDSFGQTFQDFVVYWIYLQI
jgi:hypothetical protein